MRGVIGRVRLLSPRSAPGADREFEGLTCYDFLYEIEIQPPPPPAAARPPVAFRAAISLKYRCRDVAPVCPCGGGSERSRRGEERCTAG
jgi:hypothetical protein